MFLLSCRNSYGHAILPTDYSQDLFAQHYRPKLYSILNIFRFHGLPIRSVTYS